MCRLAVLVADRPRPLSALLYDAPHSLERQSYAPREMIAGTVNVDGTGVAWWPEREDEPLRYVTERPPWSDPNLPQLARRLRGRVQLACVRSATPGLAFGAAAVQPFAAGRIAGALNGFIEGYRDGMERQLALRLPEAWFGRLASGSDASSVFLLAASRAGGEDPEALARAAASAVSETAALCRRDGRAASLNLVLVTGRGVAAVRAAEGLPPNTLYVRLEKGCALEVASEPTDPGGEWRSVPPGRVVFGTELGVRTVPLEEFGS
ncbi:MAG: ergothioneine biosynthesis protein EgtC [Acidobacteria bacterium]|nr:MAG: ergothioneine biosynthesis protein EgtC [Acidobacteriota bacterium]